MRSRQEQEKLTFGTWNVRTLLDRNESIERPECRTATVARELGLLGIDIAALSETRLSDEGQLEEIGGGYMFFWKGLPAGERRDYGH